MTILECFKSYDVRGQLGRDLDPEICERIGRSFALTMQPVTTVIGRDCRISSPELHGALVAGLRAGGSDVIDIGLCCTEEMYFATAHFEAGGGMMVTGSHNPSNFNGVKMVGRGARPLTADSGLLAVHDTAAMNKFPHRSEIGTLRSGDAREAYAAKVMSFVDPAVFRPLTILVDAGHGAAGPTFDAIADALTMAGAPLTFVRQNHAPDGAFPKGQPNPMLPEHRAVISEGVKQAGADFGVAWDGDGDRCIFFDARGNFISGEYIVALLATSVLQKEAGARIVHDVRACWNIEDTIASGGGTSVPAPAGHTVIKAAMAKANAIYGGEMSAHHYFRDFMYCDSGMIPWLLVVELVSSTGLSLSSLVSGMRRRFPSSGEISFPLAAPEAMIETVTNHYRQQDACIAKTDGLSLTFQDWRMHLRPSSSEAALRLTIETRGDPELLDRKVAEVTALITGAT